MAETVTMADLRQACEDRLDHALATGEEGVRVKPLEQGNIESFETPAGLEIRRIAGGLSINCDFSELSDEEFKEITIHFDPDSEVPEVVEVFGDDDGFADKTLPRTRHDEVAAELIRYVTLIP